MEPHHSSPNVPRGQDDVEPDDGIGAHVLGHDEGAPTFVVRGSPDPAPVARSGDRPQRGTERPQETTISSSPPMPLRPLAEGLLPRDLGPALEGQQLDDVFLERFVGGGGMGAVFRALDTKLNRTVAVKVLSTYQSKGADTEQRFETEARSAARLDHPNIARVYYAGEARGVRYITFEYIEGTNVRDLVKAHGPFPLADALRYTLQIADALAHAWQREVVHRDIKPSNILINADGQAKLVDMGLARYGPMDQTNQELTASGVTLGTFDYISPEQARDPRQADTRSDIYSLGCTLFFMLAGRPPFPGGTMLQKVLQHQADPPPDLRQIRPDVPEPVVKLLKTMLAKKADDRFQNPAELVAVLASCTEQLGIGYVQFALPAGWSGQAMRPSAWRRHAVWIMPCVLLLAAVIGLEWMLNRDAAPPAFPELRIPQVAAPIEQGAGRENLASPSSILPAPRSEL